MPAFALRTRETQFAECFSRVVLVRISLELWPYQGFDFLNNFNFTLADRHFTTSSLGAESSGYIYNI
jgi:hypothetical protein